MDSVAMELLVGCMCSRKTRGCIERFRRAEREGMERTLWVADVPGQHDGPPLFQVTDRDGASAPGQPWHWNAPHRSPGPEEEIAERRRADRGPWVVLVDEIQFATVEAVLRIYAACRGPSIASGTVVLAGLTLDYRGVPWDSVQALWPLVDRSTFLTATCSCGAPATRSYRTVASTERILQKTADNYEALCRRCFDARVQP